MKQSSHPILFLLSGLLVLMAVLPAQAQRSRRVIHQDLSPQPSTKTAPRIDESVTAPQNGNADSSVGLPIGWQPKPVHASSGVTAATAITSTPTDDNQQTQQLLQALQSMMSPKPQTGPTGAAASPPNSTLSGGGTSGQNSGDTPSSNAPLPQDTSVTNRSCPGGPTWQPFTAKPFRLTSCYGFRKSKGRHHNGIDVVIEGGAINPVAPGRIVSAGVAGGYGCQIVIEHESCPSAIGGTKCHSQYAHLKKENGECPATGKIGTQVDACTQLATMGNTGASDAPHLHFEVRTGFYSSNAVDPVTKFREWQAHSNYQYDKSTCGTVGNGQAPTRQTVPGGQNHDNRR